MSKKEKEKKPVIADKHDAWLVDVAMKFEKEATLRGIEFGKTNNGKADLSVANGVELGLQIERTTTGRTRLKFGGGGAPKFSFTETTRKTLDMTAIVDDLEDFLAYMDIRAKSKDKGAKRLEKNRKLAESIAKKTKLDVPAALIGTQAGLTLEVRNIDGPMAEALCQLIMGELSQ